jgi:hypothetical protein
VLNSIALLAFPAIGAVLHMTQTQFGLWSALAIHDTSSVVGATAKFGVVALAVGTTVKLARALWIVPMSIGTSLFNRSKARIHLPWFILFFCLAAVANIRSHLPGLLSKPQASRYHRPDRHSFSDWKRPLEEDPSRGRCSTVAARGSALDCRCGGITRAGSRRMDSSVVLPVGSARRRADEDAEMMSGKTAGNHTLDLLQDRTCGYSPATRSVDHREKISQSCAACLGSSGPGTSPFLFALLALAHCNRHAACHGAEGVVTS